MYNGNINLLIKFGANSFFEVLLLHNSLSTFFLNKQFMIFIVEVSWIFGFLIVVVAKFVKSIFNNSKLINSLSSLFFTGNICPSINNSFFCQLLLFLQLRLCWVYFCYRMINFLNYYLYHVRTHFQFLYLFFHQL